jgi:TRAP-type C4-dicarboxylate transport system permease small subunit
VSAGLGSDLRVALVATLMPFGAGMLLLLGYLWFDFFGAILGVGAAIWWAVWWRKKHDGTFFPKDVKGGPFAGTIAIALVVFLFAISSQ